MRSREEVEEGETEVKKRTKWVKDEETLREKHDKEETRRSICRLEMAGSAELAMRWYLQIDGKKWSC